MAWCLIKHRDNFAFSSSSKLITITKVAKGMEFEEMYTQF